MIGQSNQDVHSFSPSMVLSLSEAAWIIKKQGGLQGEVASYRKRGFTPVDDYQYPAWRSGMKLAAQTREKLGYKSDEPIRGLKDIVENKLGIPVIQADLNPRFAGATIANGTARGIVLNLGGPNQNVWVRGRNGFRWWSASPPSSAIRPCQKLQ